MEGVEKVAKQQQIFTASENLGMVKYKPQVRYMMYRALGGGGTAFKHSGLVEKRRQ